MVAGQEINFSGQVAGWGGIRNKAQLRPAKAGAGAWPELGKKGILMKSPFRHTLKKSVG